MLEEELRKNARTQGQRIYEAIKARGIPQVEIARRLGWGASHLSMTLKRIRDGRFTLRTLASLGLAVGIYWDLEFVPMKPTAPTRRPGEGLAILCLAV